MKEYLLLWRGGKLMSSKTEAENKAELQAWGAYKKDLFHASSLARISYALSRNLPVLAFFY